MLSLRRCWLACSSQCLPGLARRAGLDDRGQGVCRRWVDAGASRVALGPLALGEFLLQQPPQKRAPSEIEIMHHPTCCRPTHTTRRGEKHTGGESVPRCSTVLDRLSAVGAAWSAARRQLDYFVSSSPPPPLVLRVGGVESACLVPDRCPLGLSVSCSSFPSRPSPASRHVVSPSLLARPGRSPAVPLRVRRRTHHRTTSRSETTHTTNRTTRTRAGTTPCSARSAKPAFSFARLIFSLQFPSARSALPPR